MTQQLMKVLKEKFENTLFFKNGLLFAHMILNDTASYLESENCAYAQVALFNFHFLICA